MATQCPFSQKRTIRYTVLSDVPGQMRQSRCGRARASLCSDGTSRAQLLAPGSTSQLPSVARIAGALRDARIDDADALIRII